MSQIPARVDCSISIVNFNTRDLIVQCLESLLACTKGMSYELIVVDNASTDGSVDKIRERFPNVQVIENRENLFFTKASNQGMRASQGRYVMTLNPDCYLKDDAISAMVRFMEQNPQVGACGPTFLNPDGTLQSMGHRFPGILFPFFQLFFINTVFPSNPVRTAREYRENKLQEIDAMGGGGIMVRREVLDSAGYLDEGYLMYFEDTDWCRRIHDAGWPIMHLPDSRVYHIAGSATVKVNRIKFERILFQSMMHYYRKHYGFAVSACLTLLLYGFHYPVLNSVRFVKARF